MKYLILILLFSVSTLNAQSIESKSPDNFQQLFVKHADSVIDYYNNKYGELMVLLKSYSINHPENEVYSFIRFFRIGEKIEVSIEIPFKNIKKLVVELFRNLE